VKYERSILNYECAAVKFAAELGLPVPLLVDTNDIGALDGKTSFRMTYTEGPPLENV
jgi:hypothetical protein